MSLSCSSPDRIKPDTPQPSFCCFPFLGQTLPTSKPPLFGIFMAAATIRPVCCASLLSLCLCRSRNQFVAVAARCSSPRLFSSPRSRTPRSFKPFMPPIFRQCSSHASVVVPPLAFFAFFSSPRCPGCCFTCYRCICSYPIHSFEPFPSDLYIRSYCISLPPHSICLVRFNFRSRFTCRPCSTCPT